MIRIEHSPRYDAGHGVSLEERRMAGQLAHVAYWHPRPDGGGECYGCIPIAPYWPDGWDLVSESPLTISPSLLCTACGHHGFVRAGHWEPA